MTSRRYCSHVVACVARTSEQCFHFARNSPKIGKNPQPKWLLFPSCPANLKFFWDFRSWIPIRTGNFGILLGKIISVVWKHCWGTKASLRTSTIDILVTSTNHWPLLPITYLPRLFVLAAILSGANHCRHWVIQTGQLNGEFQDSNRGMLMNIVSA